MEVKLVWRLYMTHLRNYDWCHYNFPVSRKSSFSVNRSFCQICQNCIKSRKKFSKNLTSNRNWTLDPRTVSTAHFLSLMPYHCARSHCLKDWDFNDPYIVMLYWFQLNPLSSSVQKSIKHDYIRIFKVSVFQAMGSSTVVRHDRQEVSSTQS